MEIAEKLQGYTQDWDPVANLDAWEGYEFWSSQLEAEMDMPESFHTRDWLDLSQSRLSEVAHDGFPF